MLKRYLIERDIAGVGRLSIEDCANAAGVSNAALEKVSGIQWQQSYVAADKTFCIYLAESEFAIREHARLSGFPANRITEVPCIIDPTTEGSSIQAALEAAG